MQPKVLIACPINETKDYCIRKWLKYVCSQLTYQNYEVYLVDNSKNKHWHKKLLKEVGFLYPNLTIDHYRPSAKHEYTIAETIALCQNKIITYAKKVKALKWMSIECDNFSEQDIIERLQAHMLPAVGAYYHTYLGYERTPLMQKVDNEDLAPIMEMRPRLIPYQEAVSMIKAELQLIHGIGLGCVMLDMEIFDLVDQDNKPIQFRSNEIGKGLSDSYFYADLQSWGIDVYLDPTIRCIHENDSWTYKNTVEALDRM